MWPFCVSYGILVLQPEIELTPPAVEVQNLNHWIAREVPQLHLLSLEYKSSYFMQRFQFSGQKESGSGDQEIHAIPRLVRVLEIPQGPVLTVYSKSLQLCPTLGPMDCSYQAPLSVGFSRQEYWSGLPCPPPGCTYYNIFKVQGGPKGPQFSEESLLPLVQLEKTGGKSVELVTHCVRRFCPVLSMVVSPLMLEENTKTQNLVLEVSI